MTSSNRFCLAKPSPNSSSQYETVENWAKYGGKLFSTIPITNSRVTEVWQWPVSSPDGEDFRYGLCSFYRLQSNGRRLYEAGF